MKNSHYANYVEERGGKILEDEDGFATYIIEEDTCYIKDIYVIKEKRQDGTCFKYTDKIVGIAKEVGCSTLLGTVDMNANGAETSNKVLVAYGFKPFKYELGLIWYKKEI